MGLRKFTKAEEKRIIIPLIKKLLNIHKKGQATFVALQGGQGTGKTTIVKYLKKYLKKEDYKVQSFSIDDFYKSNLERKKLREKFIENPFYQISRGLPGTHRINKLNETLKKAKSGESFEIPIFDKSLHHGQGDILKRTIQVKGKQDFILFEGWCVGIPTVSSKIFIDICKKNKINLKKLDPQLKEHKVVLQFIKDYQKLWKFLDYVIMIKPDSSKFHKEWRLLQEIRMKKRKKEGMSEKEIDQFVEPYLPFTYVCYDLLNADLQVLVGRHHNYYKIISRK